MRPLQLESLNVSGRTVFLRADFNVPLADGAVADSTRIDATLPTLRILVERGARVVCASHLGRPKGVRSAAASLRPVAAALAERIGREVRFVDDCIGDSVHRAVEQLADGHVALLENLRFHAGEEANDPEFARELGRIAPLYVNDAFGASHRAHASIVGITAHVERAAAGLLLGREVVGLRRAIVDPPKPVALVVGGAKVRDKIPLVAGLVDRLDRLLIGGAMAYTFLRVRGVPVGRSRVEEDQLEVAAEVLAKADKYGVEVLLPVDHVVALTLESDESAIVGETEAFPGDMMGLDIGPSTRARYATVLHGARTIIWNGPMGVFERSPFAAGTLDVARAVAASTAYSVVGGGDSAAALNMAGVQDQVSHLSTGGGASLEFLAGRTLPGLAALSDADE